MRFNIKIIGLKNIIKIKFFLAENNVILDFSTQGITYSVNNKKISFKFQGDKEGTLLVTVNETTYSLWYYMDDVEKKVVVDDEGMFDSLISEYLNSLTNREKQTLRQELDKLGNLYPNFQSTISKTKARSDCERYRDKAIEAFVVCSVTDGLGCLAGAYYLYEEWLACVNGE